MRDIPAALLAHLGLEVTTLATCWQLTRKDSTVFRYTDHDDDLVVDGGTYRADTGFTRSAVDFKITLAVNNSDITGIFNGDEISEADLVKGLFDDAEIRMLVVNWRDPAMGIARGLRGWLGPVTRTGEGFTAEVRSLSQLFASHIGSLTSPRCRSAFGDTGAGSSGGCRFAVPETATAVGAVTNRKTFGAGGGGGAGAGGTLDGGYFALGTATFTSGANAGVVREIDSDEGGVLTLFDPVPYDLAPGDGVTLRPGCDKTVEVCSQNWDNFLNFRGEPYVPGNDFMFRIRRARGGGGKK